MHNDYELEIAYRKMSELQNQAAHDVLVKTLKAAKREQPGSSWPSLIWHNLVKLGKRSASAAVNKSTYGRQVAPSVEDK